MTAGEGEPVRVLLVDDQELVRSGLRRILRRRDGFVITGECGDGADVPAALAAAEADVVVMDLRMKHVDGIEATRRLRRAGRRPPVLALTTFDDDELLAGALRAGAVGYILKDSSAEELIRAVRAVAAGDAWLDAAVTARVLTTYRRAAVDGPAGVPPNLLTPRELDVLRAAGRGLTNAEIAAALVVSELTVKSHLSRIFAKLGLRDRAAAVVYAFDHGIVSPRTVRPPVESIVDDAPPVPVREPEPAPGLRFSVLGPLRAWRGGTPLDLGPVRQQALLAALLLRVGATVSQSELLRDVWGLEPPGTGLRVLPVYVHKLRKCLRGPGERTPDSVIGHTRGGYRLAADGVRTDVARLAELDADAGAAEEAGDLEAAVASCAAALGLFHGEPLAGLPGPFADGQRLRLTERRSTLWTRKARLQLRLGHAAEAADELAAVLALEPLREPLAVLLMRALQATGRRAEAIAVYGRIRDRLAQDLGVEPGDELRRTHRAVLDDVVHRDFLGSP